MANHNQEVILDQDTSDETVRKFGNIDLHLEISPKRAEIYLKLFLCRQTNETFKCLDFTCPWEHVRFVYIVHYNT